MPSYNIFFFGTLFFLLGVFLKSLGWGIGIVFVTGALAAVFLLGIFFSNVWRLNLQTLNLKALVFISFFILVGAVYYQWDDGRFRDTNIVFDQKIEFRGLVVNDPTIRESFQEMKIKLYPPYRGHILLRTALVPRYAYGDELSVTGVIQKPFNSGYGDYLAKERISGTLSYAEIEIVSRGGGSLLKRTLFALKNNMLASFQRTLPPQEASFLGGITVGSRSGFSKEFKEAMSLSGTTHIIALSGYNISIVVMVAMGLFAYFFPRRVSFLLTIFVVIAFVIMTGAEASVVRAAVMGLLVLFSQALGRAHSMRNPIILAGLLMTLVNPKVLVFDIGFQLSFLALLGIVYLKPAAQRLFRLPDDSGFLSWRENLLTTASAQVMVIPVLMANFGMFSVASLAANVVILEFIPLTMGLGFFQGFMSFVSYYAGLVAAWLTSLFLKFEIFVIEFFARVSIPVQFDFSPAVVLLYYTAIGFFILRLRKSNEMNETVKEPVAAKN